MIVIPEGGKRTSFQDPSEMKDFPGQKRPSIPVHTKIIVPEGGKRTSFQTAEEVLMQGTSGGIDQRWNDM